jgi:hypothetical protein
MRLLRLTLAVVPLALAAGPLRAQSDAEVRFSLGHLRAFGAGGYVVAVNGNALDHIYGRSIEVLLGLSGWYGHAAIASRPLDTNGRRLFGVGPTLELRTVSLRHLTEFYAQATGQFAYSSVARYTVPVSDRGAASMVHRALGPDSVPPTPQVDEAETRTGFAWGVEAGIRQPIDRRVGIVASVVALKQRLYPDAGRLWLRYQLGVRIGRGP